MLTKIFFAALIFVLASFTIVSSVAASVLLPDNSLDSDGELYFLQSEFYAYAITVDETTNKFYVAGDYSDGIDQFVRVYGFNADGTLDNSFGVAGIVDIYGGDSAYASKIFMRGNKIGVLGVTYSPATESDITYWQLNLDGSFDLDINGTGVVAPSLSYLETSPEIMFSPSGEIYTLAETFPTPPALSQNNITVVKFNADGSEDNTFGPGYFEYTLGPLNHYHHPKSIFFDPDGKIIVAGYYDDEVVDPHISMLRINLDGTYDATFGTNGLVTYFPGRSAAVYDVLEAEDGQGLIFFANDNSEFYAYKMKWDGTVDTSFGTNGEVLVSNEYFTAFAYLGNGDWMLGGSVDDGFGASNSLMCQYDDAFALKSNFADNGCFELDGYYYDYVTGIAEANDATYVLSQEDGGNFVLDKYLLNYQIDFGANPIGFSAYVDGGDVALNSVNGARGVQTTQIKIGSALLANVSKTFSMDHDWSGLSGGIDISAGKSFVHGLTSQPGAASTYTLYVPKTTGSNAVHICPGATSLANISESCSGGVSYQVGESGVTVENIDEQDYWVVPNMTSTGGISIASSSTLPDTGVDIYAFFSIPLAISVLAFAVLKKHLEVV